VVEAIKKIAWVFLQMIRDFPRLSIIFFSGVSVLILLATSMLTYKNLAPLPIREQINIPLTYQPVELKMQIDSLSWKTEQVGSGDNFSALAFKAKLSNKDVYELSSSPKGKELKKLFPGESFKFGVDSKGKLQKVLYIKSPLETHIYSREDGKYIFNKQLHQPEIILAYREGVIKDSLYLSGKTANLPDKIIMELANIFGWDIDFVFDIRPGDSFSVLFEDRFIDGNKLAEGNILAASFTNRKTTFKAVRFAKKDGIGGYFSPEGLSMRKAFLRTPLDIFRISSGFNLRRKHPIHKKIKAHRGVDYAAPRGTPVYATGAGKVVEAGYTIANGNYVFIKHGQTYTTKYLHLHNKKVRKGQSIKQRQLIGTVGSTGYATGPHLHYEFLVNGIHRNPRTVKLPQAKPIENAEKDNFVRATQPMLAQLIKFQAKNQLAKIEGQSANVL
jgi:murein DD-endopeptidase MepM/ murein hydrolase activator NlpD